MKKLIIIASMSSLLLIGSRGITGGDIIGGSVAKTQQKLKLSKGQLDQLRKSGDFYSIYEEWKRMGGSADMKEQALKHAFEKFIVPQVDPGAVDEDDFFFEEDSEESVEE